MLTVSGLVSIFEIVGCVCVEEINSLDQSAVDMESIGIVCCILQLSVIPYLTNWVRSEVFADMSLLVYMYIWSIAW